MSLRFPIRRLFNGAPMDVDDLNELFQGFVDEVNGNLNQHNWRLGSFDAARDRVADDAGIKLYHAYKYVDGSDLNAAPTDTWEQPTSMGWTAVPDTEVTVEGPGLLWVLAGGQVSMSNFPGVRYCIRINGDPEPDSIVPYADLDLERCGNYTTLDAGGIVGTGTAGITPGIMDGYTDYGTEAMIDIPAGTHVVDLAAAVVMSDGGLRSQSRRHYTRELIAVVFKV